MYKLNEHLKVKKRSISSLVDFVKTRTGKAPNYTLLLGSGASVTSGVRSATTLVAEWRRDLYYKLCSNPVDPYSLDEAIEYFTRQHGDWYSPQREYASLFEKKFDLPRQRRMFVENEVSARQPSLGYAYLVRLIERNYFNTVFTTNFDDLLNEAFHQFSDRRPIVCAHDSSIASITVTSERPKIIKLHGDYLFDDIKSTVRETESLEENTKKKFSEFAKDHGLIVIGYSGHDRSVMDVLHFLLKQDDYFKHGIYWCLRENDTQSEDLVKLLWKEKVYWVDIEGYDEVLSQLYSECIGDDLPISTSLVSQKPREVIERFCTDDYLARSQSEIIKKDLIRLKRELDREALVNSLRTVARLDREDYRAPSELNDRDMIKLMEIRQLVEDKEYDQARQKIGAELKQEISQDYRTELLLSRLEVEHETAQYDSAIQTCELLLQYDQKNAYYFLKRAENEQSQERRLVSIGKALELDPYYPGALRLRARFREEELRRDPRCDEQRTIRSIIADYIKAIEQNPSIENTAWVRLAKFLLSHKSAASESALGVRDIYARLSTMDAFSEIPLSLAVDLAKPEKDAELEREEVLASIRKAIDVQPIKRRKRLELVYLDALWSFQMHADLLSKVASFEAETRWQEDRDFIKLRAEIYVEVEGRLFEAVRTLESYKRLRKDSDALRMLIKYLTYQKRAADAQKLLDENRGILAPEVGDGLQADIYSCEGAYAKVLTFVRGLMQRSKFPTEWNTLETHALIKIKQYADAERILREILEAGNYSLRFAHWIINLELTTWHQVHKVNKPRLSKITESEDVGGLVRMCAFLLLDEKSRAAECLAKEMKKDRATVYEVSDWAIFDIAPNRAWLKEVLGSHGWLDETTSTREVRRVGS